MGPTGSALTAHRVVIHFRPVRLPPSIQEAQTARLYAGLFVPGGDEGNRTPVRKFLDTTFFVGSHSFRFPSEERRMTGSPLR